MPKGRIFKGKKLRKTYVSPFYNLDSLNKKYKIDKQINVPKELIGKGEAFTFIASSEVIDRDGDIIMQEGLNFGEVNRNMPSFFNHNMNFLLGHVLRTHNFKGLTNNPTFADIFILKDATLPSAVKAIDAIKSKSLRAVSIGMIVDEYHKREDGIGYIITKATVIEISVVTIPANQEALLIDLSLENGLLPDSDVVINEPDDEYKSKEGGSDVEKLMKLLDGITLDELKNSLIGEAINKLLMESKIDNQFSTLTKRIEELISESIILKAKNEELESTIKKNINTIVFYEKKLNEDNDINKQKVKTVEKKLDVDNFVSQCFKK